MIFILAVMEHTSLTVALTVFPNVATILTPHPLPTIAALNEDGFTELLAELLLTDS